MSIKRRKGFFLLEIVLGTAFLGITTLLFGREMLSLFGGWRRMETDADLLDAGRYMLTKLERHIALEATSITLHNNEIRCKTVYPAKTTRVFLNPSVRGLYFETTTNEGVGTNPLFIRDCLVSNWRVRRKGERQVYLSFTLTKNERTKDFYRLLNCVNGKVQNDS